MNEGIIMKLSVDQRFWIVKCKLRGVSVTFICERAGISRDTFYRFWRRFQSEGWAGLGLRSHKPQTIHKTSQDTTNLVLNLRQTHGGGPSRIEGYLRQERLEGIEPVGHNTVYRILKEAGLNSPLDEPRKTWGTKRFQRSSPNELWHSKLLGSLRAQTALPSVASRLEAYERR